MRECSNVVRNKSIKNINNNEYDSLVGKNNDGDEISHVSRIYTLNLEVI